MLVIDGDPLLPADQTCPRRDRKTRGQSRQSGGEGRRGSSPLLPDFADASRLYMRRLMAFLGASFPPEVDRGRAGRRRQLTADNSSLAAERLRGMIQSHRDWLFDDGARSRLRVQWSELFKSFDAVICPIMPTPAYPHDHSPQQESRRIRIDGQDYDYPDQLAWPGFATLPGLPATAIPLGLTAGPAGRGADRRPLAGGPHALEAGGTDRARVRRLRAAANV